MPARARRLAPGVNVVGYLNHTVGLGESARRCIGALRAVGVPCAGAAVSLDGIAPRHLGDQFPELDAAELPYGITFVWVNPDRYGIDLEPEALPGRRIGRWVYELDDLPQEWAGRTDALEEIWTPTRFTRATIGRAVDVPVREMPMVIDLPDVPRLERGRWNIPDDRVLFLFAFDYNSAPERKNPLGLIQAFRRAFPDDRQAALLVKSVNAHRWPEEAEALDRAAHGHPGIHLADVNLSPGDRLVLLAGCDCYVSLHRGGGFEMTIAEAMGYGRPVIATDYGGSTDYVTRRVGHPIPWEAIGVTGRHPAYPADLWWADADLAAAAAAMRRVAEHPSAARRRGRRAARRIRRRYAPSVAGRQIARQLQALEWRR